MREIARKKVCCISFSFHVVSTAYNIYIYSILQYTLSQTALIRMRCREFGISFGSQLFTKIWWSRSMLSLQNIAHKQNWLGGMCSVFYVLYSHNSNQNVNEKLTDGASTT